MSGLSMDGRAVQYVYLASQPATIASLCAIDISAYARAARGRLSEARCSNMVWLAIRYQARNAPSIDCAANAAALVSNVLAKFFTSSSSIARSGESKAHGGPGRNCLGACITQVFQEPASGYSGFVPFHRPGPVGTMPLPLLVETVGPCPLDHKLAHPSAQGEAGSDIASKVHSSEETRACALGQEGVEAVRILRVQIGKNGSGRGSYRRVLARIRRTARNRNCRRQGRVQLARPRARIRVLRVPRRNGGLVYRHVDK